MTRSIEISDRAGIVVAVACAIHCVAAPILGASIQVVGAFASERTELLFLASSLLVSGTTVVTTCLRRRAPRTVWGAFVFGASSLLCARAGLVWAEGMEQPLVLAGAGLIVASHLINLFNCRCNGEGPSCMVAE